MEFDLQKLGLDFHNITFPGILQLSKVFAVKWSHSLS